MEEKERFWVPETDKHSKVEVKESRNNSHSYLPANHTCTHTRTLMHAHTHAHAHMRTHAHVQLEKGVASPLPGLMQ